MKLRVFVLPLLLLYPLYVGVMFGRQQQILFPAASAQHHPMNVEVPAYGRLVEIGASFGRVRLFYQPVTPNRRGPAEAILYTHGNFECIQDSFALMRPLVDAGSSVLQLEFPGFCGADGEPSFANIVEAEELAYDWLARCPEVDKSRIVAMGYSMGGGAAADLTGHRPVRALALLSTYTSISDLARRYLLPGFVVRYPFDNVGRLRKFSGPVFIEHGRRDAVIPFTMGEALARGKSGSNFIVLDCGHDDCHFERSLFAERIPEWLRANGVSVAATH